MYFAVVLMHSSLTMFFFFLKRCFVRGRCGKSLRLDMMVGVTNAGQCDLSVLSAVVIVFGD